MEGLSNGTEVEFRVRARLAAGNPRTAAWTEDDSDVEGDQTKTTPQSTNNFAGSAFRKDKFVFDTVENGTITPGKLTVHYHDEPTRFLDDEGLTDYTVQRTFYFVKFSKDTPRRPITAVGFELLIGRALDGPVVKTLHEGASHDQWASLGYPSSVVEVASDDFDQEWFVESSKGWSADEVRRGTGGGANVLATPTVMWDPVNLNVPGSLDRALNITWQPDLWPGSRNLDHTMCIQWKSGSEEFDTLASGSTRDRTVVLSGQTLITALKADGYTLSGLEEATSYDVRTIRCAAGDETLMVTSSSAVTGTTLDTPPIAELVRAPADGATVDIVFGQDLDTAGSAPAASAFDVAVGTAGAVNPASVAFHSTDADTFTLTMGAAIAGRPSVTVAYTKPSSNALADATGNEVDDFTQQAYYAPAAPGKPTLTASDVNVWPDGTALDASWDAPTDDGGAPVTGYEVQWRLTESPNSQTWAEAIAAGQTASATTSPYRITGLTNGAEYAVRVIALNVVGPSLASDEQSRTPAPAPRITGIAVTSTPQAGTIDGTSSVPDTYGRGEDIEITITFDEAVDATADLSGNTPTFAIRLIHGGVIQTRDLRLLRGSGATELVFVYTVDTDDNERAGLSALSNNLSSDGQIVSSASGVPAVRDHDGVPLQQGHKVNGALTEGDARLSALSLSGITLDQAFEPSRNEYTATTTGARTTLAYTELTNRAIVISRYISPSDAAIADLGHQVDLEPGDTVISVWVNAPLCGSEDVCRAHRIYTITVTRAAARSDLPPPRNLRAVEEKGAVKLNWDAPDDDATVTGYRIERRLADGLQRDNHTLVEDTGSSETGYTDESAEKGVEYEYRVSARNEDGAGEASGWVSAAPDEEPVASEDVAVWSATLTVEWVYQGYGYYSTDTKKAGSLSPASFEVDGTTYTVKMVETQGWWTYIGVDRELPFDFLLELDGTRFASGDASFNSYSYGNIYRWEGTGLSLSDGDTVEVRLHRASEDETAVNSPATGQPTISGTAQVGETLTADTSGIADEDGLDNAAFSYQWLADDTEVAGATGSTYTLVEADEGKAIKVQVSFTDDARQ